MTLPRGKPSQPIYIIYQSVLLTWMFIGMVGVSLKINSCNLMIVLDVFATFAENKLRSAKQERISFAIACYYL